MELDPKAYLTRYSTFALTLERLVIEHGNHPSIVKSQILLRK